VFFYVKSDQFVVGISMTERHRPIRNRLTAVLLSLMLFLGIPFLVLTRDRGPSDDQIRKAIIALRSPVSPPLAQGEWPIKSTLNNGYMHPTVRDALDVIDQATPDQFSLFIPYFNDQSYSYSLIYAAWNNISVGEALINSITNRCGAGTVKNGYKSRETPKGYVNQPSFIEMIYEVGQQKWAAQQSGKSIADIRAEYAVWYRAQEEALGFISEKQRREIFGDD
jgi:hypothetical protein